MSWNASLVDGPIPTYKQNSYDINISVSCMTSELENYVVEPSMPKRVFAGDDPENRTETVCLSFPNEATAISLIPELWIEEDNG